MIEQVIVVSVNAVRARLRRRPSPGPAHRPRHLAADPRHQRDARPPCRRRAQRRVVRRCSADRIGFPTVEVLDGRPLAARRLRRVAERRPGRAGRPRLRPPRRPARRPAGAVAHRPVRPDRRRRRAARAGRVRRQGPTAVPPARAARAPRRERPHGARGHAEVPHRGRGGVRLAALRGHCSPRTATASTPTSSSSPTPAWSPPTSRARSPACAAWSRARSSFHGPDLDLHSGVFGGAVPNPATAIARLVAALHDDRRTRAGARLLRRRPRPHRRRARPVREACRTTTASS